MIATSLLTLALALSQSPSGPLVGSPPETLGIVASQGTRRVVTFDADTHQVLGSVAFTALPGACRLTSDLRLAIVTTSSGRLHFLALRDGVPTFGPAGPSPLILSSAAHAAELTPDDRFVLLATTEGSIQVVDVALRQVVDVFFNGPSSNLDCVGVGPGGMVLVGDSDSNEVLLLQLGPGGALTSTGASLSLPGVEPQRLAFLPDGSTAVVLDLYGGISTITVPGLQVVSSKPVPVIASTPGWNNSCLVVPEEQAIFVRNAGAVFSFGYDPRSSSLGDQRWTSLLPAANSFGVTYGAEYLARHPVTGRIYTTLGDSNTTPEGIEVRDPDTGALVDLISDPTLDSVQAIDLRRRSTAPVRLRSDPLPR